MILMRSCPGNMPTYYPGLRDILPDHCLSDLGNILAYKTTLSYKYYQQIYIYKMYLFKSLLLFLFINFTQKSLKIPKG